MKAAALFLTVLGFAVPGHPQSTIGSFLSVSETGGGLVLTNATFWFGESPSFFPPNPVRDAVIFEHLSLTPADVGRTFIVAAGDDPDFERLAALLTNGVQDPFGYLLHDIAGTSGYENVLFAPLPRGSGAVDFQGYTIDQFSLELLALTIASPGSNLSNDGRWTDITMSIRFSVIGHAVPEPSGVALTLTSVGLLALAGHRKARAEAVRRKSTP
jgi:hypothetical protein